MFKKVLIANRGEIAVRIARTCRKMGIATVAVFSEADRNALHVRACDEAYPIGPPPASESYLRGDKILEAANATGAEAIHPGYGFLSENAAFARQVIAAGLVWIGPPPEAIGLMGSKIESKKLAEKAGVPIVPGYMGEDQSADRLVEEARQMGFPVLVKASAGGGGKGMRVVRSADQMRDSVEAAQREAQAAFGDATLLLEKYLENPRHIEVQVLGDNYGKLVHLGERECSIQRRHQKVVEESPSPVVTPEMRDKITGAGLALARAAGYTNAGTVEFVYENGNFYFLEMNTRLQVEHPVTEEALGLDLVKEQLRIAAGERLWFDQGDVHFKRHSIEVRLYAEDPEHDFLPSTGRLDVLVFPPDRVDTGFEQGNSVSPYYDPMIAKIITSGTDRAAAIRKMQDALGSMRVEGVRTNLDFLRWLFSNAQFQAGDFSTSFIARNYSPGEREPIPEEVVLAAGATLLLGPVAETRREIPPPFPWGSTPWRQGRQDMVVHPVVDGQEFTFTASAMPGAENGWNVEVRRGATPVYGSQVFLAIEAVDLGASTYVVRLRMEGKISFINIPYSTWQSSLQDDRERTGSLFWKGHWITVRRAPALSTDRLDVGVHRSSDNSLESPMPGKVLKVLVKEGDRVEDEQPLVIVEAMKMEFVVRAPHEGEVVAVHYTEGSQVAVGDVLLELKN